MKILENNVTNRWYNNIKTLKQKRPGNPKGKKTSLTWASNTCIKAGECTRDQMLENKVLRMVTFWYAVMEDE